jgi:hypothetical protein
MHIDFWAGTSDFDSLGNTLVRFLQVHGEFRYVEKSMTDWGQTHRVENRIYAMLHGFSKQFCSSNSFGSCRLGLRFVA